MDSDGYFCPLCENKVDPAIPNAAAVINSLAQIDRSLSRVGVESPHFQSQLAALSDAKSRLEIALVENQKSLETAYREDEKARSRREMIVDRASVIGRISAFLEQIGQGEQDNDLAEKIERAKLKVIAMETAVNPDEIGQRLDTFLNLISRQMSDYARRLDLEHGSDSVRLDLKKLTVVADTATGPIPLNRMGNGEKLDWLPRADTFGAPPLVSCSEPAGSWLSNL